MYSYTKTLTKYLRQLNPINIFEWGPERSTKLILDNISSDSTLTSVEHDSYYYDKIKNELADPRWTIHNIKVSGRVSQYAHIIKKYPKMDLIFVDGRRRVECIFAALTSITPTGVIILHDSNRKSYTEIINPFIEPIENVDNTLVFRSKFNLA